MKKLFYLIFILSQIFTNAYALEAFIVKNIDVEGLHNLSKATVLNYLPIKPGETLRPKKTKAILAALYKTNFFDDISLSKANNTLVIHVVERPIIGQIKIKGNSVIQTDKLQGVMKSLDVVEGRIYNPLMLERIKLSLQNQYYQLSFYNAKVEVVTQPLPRNRVSVTINISEGVVAKIRGINIIGNKAFSERTLINQLDISKTNYISFFTHSNRYSEEKLESSVDRLKNFYLNHGYIRVDVKSAQAEVTPDKKAVYVNIIVVENEPYVVKAVKLNGDLIYPEADYAPFIKLHPGERFSRTKIIETQKGISHFLGDKGYMFANVSIRPEVDDQNHTIIINFIVKPGKRAYVRNITFSDNTRTNDVVLRREVIQMEAAPASITRIEESKRNLSMLPYLKNVELSIAPVEGVDDQVDIDYQVKEDSAAQASFKVGYSQLDGPMIGAGYNQKNILGTGNTLGLNLNYTKVSQYLGFDYTNPYYTPEGISRSITIAVSRVDPGESRKVSTGYTINEIDLGALYAIPLGNEPNAFNRLIAGFAYQNIYINASDDKISNQVRDFIDHHGKNFHELDLKLGFSRDSRNRAFFPTSGTVQALYTDIYLPLSKHSLNYYTLNYHSKFYLPLPYDFVLFNREDFAYGSTFHGGANNYPFFKNFFAGGIETVRGYLGNNLGPRDSKDDAFGGNMLVAASIGLIFPSFITQNLRTSIFFDAGNVYRTLDNRNFGGSSTNSGPIRYSFGAEADILTPFGPISLSLAKAINPQYTNNKRHHSEIEAFQFLIGANF